MDERRPVPPADMPDLPNLGLLAGIIFAAFLVIGLTVYIFGEEQSPQSAAYNPPPRIQRVQPPITQPAQPAPPSTTGQGGAQ
jgi:hypothetical protein